MSLVSGVSGAKRKRGSYKKSKGKGDDESMIEGKTKSAVSGNSGRGGARKRRKSRDESVEEEEGGGEDLALETVQRTEEEKQKEIEQRAMLTEQFDADQWERYTAWRSAKLSDAVVRRVCSFFALGGVEWANRCRS
jgi:transcription initiation factor TFIID subunit 11